MSAAATPETITTTEPELTAMVKGIIDEERKVGVEAAEKVARDVLAAAGLGRATHGPVATGGDETREQEADPQLDQMRAESSRIIVSERWERQARLSYDIDPNIPEASRKLRNVEDDHWIAQWARGKWFKDLAQEGRALDFLSRKYGGQRVDGNLQTVDGALGGDLVPDAFSDLVYIQEQNSEVLAPLTTRFVHQFGNLEVPRELLGSLMTAPGVAETTDSDPPGTNVPTPIVEDVKFGPILFRVKKGKAQVKVSDELLTMTPYSLVTILAAQAGKALGIRSDNQIIVLGDGTGTNHTDSLTNSSEVDATTVGTTFTAAKILDMWGIPKAGHRRNGIWLADIEALRVLNKILDTAGGKVIFTPADAALSQLIGQGQGVTGIGVMLGRPVYEVEDTGGLLFFGDPRAIGVLDDTTGITSKVETIPMMDQQAFSWSRKRDSNILEGTGWARTTVPIAII